MPPSVSLLPLRVSLVLFLPFCLLTRKPCTQVLNTAAAGSAARMDGGREGEAGAGVWQGREDGLGLFSREVTVQEVSGSVMGQGARGAPRMQTKSKMSATDARQLLADMRACRVSYRVPYRVPCRVQSCASGCLLTTHRVDSWSGRNFLCWTLRTD